MNAAVISKFGYFNQALSNLLQRRLHVRVDSFLIGFDQLTATTVSGYQAVFLLGYDIIGPGVLDIGYIWGNFLSMENAVFLFDFDAVPDYDSNPVILNPLEDGFNRIDSCLNPPSHRKTRRGNNSFRKALQGLFRSHGHSGFLGELGKLQTFLMGGLEFYEENPQDPSIYEEFFRPGQRTIRNLLNIFKSYGHYLDYWPDKEIVSRLKSSMDTLKDWDETLARKAIDKLGTREKILDTFDMIEKDILTFNL